MPITHKQRRVRSNLDTESLVAPYWRTHSDTEEGGRVRTGPSPYDVPEGFVIRPSEDREDTWVMDVERLDRGEGRVVELSRDRGRCVVGVNSGRLQRVEVPVDPDASPSEVRVAFRRALQAYRASRQGHVGLSMHVGILVDVVSQWEPTGSN